MILAIDRPLSNEERMELYQTKLWLAFDRAWDARQECPGCMFFADEDCTAVDPRQCPAVNPRCIAAQYRRQAS